MSSALPGEIVVVVESIVGKELRVRICTDVAGVVAKALARETYKLLRAERYAYFLVAGKAKETRWVAGNTVVPTNACEPKTKFVDYGWRKGMYKAGPGNFRWISIVGRKEHRSQRCCKVAAFSLRVEAINSVGVSWGEVYLEVLLIVRHENGLCGLIVVLNQAIRGRGIWRWI